MAKKIKKGKVILVSSENTVKVEITRYKAHPLYKKKFKVSKKYLVHDIDGNSKVGDYVEIEETRPISKRKKWKIKK